MAIVYKITNTVNGKIYIGYTSRTLEERWKQHIRKSKTNKGLFACSIRKHGIDAFKPEVLVEDTDDLWCLNFAEPLLIEFFNSTDSSVGYNCTLGGSGGYLTVSASANPEYRAKRSATMKANWANPEYRAKHVATMKANWANPEFRAKRIAASKTRWANPEYRAKTSAASKTSETKAKHAAAIKASWATPEYRAKMTAAAKTRWANPEYRAKRSATFKTSETKAKHAAAIKASWVIRKLLKLSINESGLSPEIQGTSSRVDP